jgi:hypothetical protein
VVLAWKVFAALPRREQVKVALYLAGKVVSMTWLNGWKTYIVCAVGILSALVTHWNSPDLMTWPQTIEAIMAALAIAGVRHGVTTEATKSE